MTRSVPPTAFNCFICEDVRPEVGGKMTLLGFTPGTKLHVPPGSEVVQLNLSFVFIVEEVEGDLMGTFTLTGPSGVVGGPVQMNPVTVQPDHDGGLATAFQFKPTPPITIGSYIAKFVLNDRTFEKKFEILATPE